MGRLGMVCPLSQPRMGRQQRQGAVQSRDRADLQEVTLKKREDLLAGGSWVQSRNIRYDLVPGRIGVIRSK